MIHIKEQKNGINSLTDINLLDNLYYYYINLYFNILDKLSSVLQIKLNSNISYIKQYSCFCISTHCTLNYTIL